MEERGKEELPLSNTFEPCFLMSAVAGEMEEKEGDRVEVRRGQEGVREGAEGPWYTLNLSCIGAYIKTMGLIK